MIQACSHLVISAESVENMKAFFSTLFSVSPHFSNSEFCALINSISLSDQLLKCSS